MCRDALRAAIQSRGPYALCEGPGCVCDDGNKIVSICVCLRLCVCVCVYRYPRLSSPALFLGFKLDELLAQDVEVSLVEH